jgi:DNA-binding CsgD family transcriptional regulator
MSILTGKNHNFKKAGSQSRAEKAVLALNLRRN